MIIIMLTALALSADSLGGGLALGLRRVWIGWKALLAVGLVSGGLAALSLFLGGGLGALMPPGLAGGLGAAALIGMGALSIWNALKPLQKPSPQQSVRVYRDPAQGDLDGSGAIDLGEAFLLALSLSVDMLGAGIGLGLASGPALWALPPTVGAAQAFLLWLGGRIGRRLARLPMGRPALGAASGLLLIGLGAARLLL